MKSSITFYVLAALNFLSSILWLVAWYRNIDFRQSVTESLLILAVLAYQSGILTLAILVRCGICGCMAVVFNANKILSLLLLFPGCVVVAVAWMIVHCHSIFCSRVDWKYGGILLSIACMGMTSYMMSRKLSKWR